MKVELRRWHQWLRWIHNVCTDYFRQLTYTKNINTSMRIMCKTLDLAHQISIIKLDQIYAWMGCIQKKMCHQHFIHLKDDRMISYFDPPRKSKTTRQPNNAICETELPRLTIWCELFCIRSESVRRPAEEQYPQPHAPVKGEKDTRRNHRNERAGHRPLPVVEWRRRLQGTLPSRVCTPVIIISEIYTVISLWCACVT